MFREEHEEGLNKQGICWGLVAAGSWPYITFTLHHQIMVHRMKELT